MQLGLTNPLEECMSQFSDTKVASQRCHMELFNEKLMESTTFGDYSLVHSIRIAVYNKKYPVRCVTQNCGSLDRCHV